MLPQRPETEYKKVSLTQYAKQRLRQTAEGRFWDRFKDPLKGKFPGAVTAINFCPVAPHHMVTTASSRLEIRDGATTEVIKTITRFKHVAYSGTFRSDGKLLVAGGQHPLVQVFDANSRLILRTLKGHQDAVRKTVFASDNGHIWSCSDDKTIRYWDLATGAQLALLSGHGDYVRCGQEVSQMHGVGNNVYMSGSYDHTVRIWDLRDGKTSSICCYAHGYPVEDVLSLVAGPYVVSAGGECVKVWDIRKGSESQVPCLHELRNHRKTVMCLCSDASSSRLMSGSLDGLVKVYDTVNFTVTHSSKHPSPITALGLSPARTLLAVGMANGQLLVRKRSPNATPDDGHAGRKREAIQRVKTGTRAYFIRGRTAGADVQAVQPPASKRVRLQPYDLCLRHFEYGKALDAALKTRDPVVVVSVVEQLVERNGLLLALRRRSGARLTHVLEFVTKYLHDPRFGVTVSELCCKLIDMYAGQMGHDYPSDKLFVRLQRAVEAELHCQRQLLELQGCLELVASSAESPDPTQQHTRKRSRNVHQEELDPPKQPKQPKLSSLNVT